MSHPYVIHPKRKAQIEAYKARLDQRKAYLVEKAAKTDAIRQSEVYQEGMQHLAEEMGATPQR